MFPAALAGEGVRPGLVVDDGGCCHLPCGVSKDDAPDVLPVARPGTKCLHEAQRLLGGMVIEGEDDEVDVWFTVILPPLAGERDLGVVGTGCKA